MIINVDYFPSKTSIKQVSYGLKQLINYDTKINLDYGGGKYDLGTEYLLEHGITNFIYDKYSRSDEYNENTLSQIDEVDSVTILNVLNTVQSEEERLDILRHAFSLLKDGGVMMITVYRGKGDIGKLSSIKTWQENRKLKDYIKEVKKVIPNEVIIHKNCIIIYK